MSLFLFARAISRRMKSTVLLSSVLDLFATVSVPAQKKPSGKPNPRTHVCELEAASDIHHPLFGVRLKEKMDALNIPCELQSGTARFDAVQVLAFYKRYLKPQRRAQDEWSFRFPLDTGAGG